MSDITQILSQIESGDSSAADQLLPLIYDELRKLASAKLLGEKPGQTLQATALVHEAYLRILGNGSEQGWDSRGHFFAAAAESMRRILVDRAREKNAQKRGGNMSRIELGDDLIKGSSSGKDNQLLVLDIALNALEMHDETKAKLVKLRYFAGLTGEQAANALGIGVSTADKYWAYAKVWLRSEMKRIDADSC